MKFTLQAKDDVPFATPVISQVSRRALDHADTNASELLCEPVREPAFALVLGLFDVDPVCNTELNACYLHGHILLLKTVGCDARLTPKSQRPVASKLPVSGQGDDSYAARRDPQA